MKFQCFDSLQLKTEIITMLNINQIKPAAQFLRLQTVENLLPLKDHNLMYFIYCNDTILGTFFEIA